MGAQDQYDGRGDVWKIPRCAADFVGCHEGASGLSGLWTTAVVHVERHAAQWDRVHRCLCWVVDPSPVRWAALGSIWNWVQGLKSLLFSTFPLKFGLWSETA